MVDDKKGGKPEDEYFVRLEAEKLQRLAEEKAKQEAAAEKEALKQQHWMRCPKCGHELQVIKYRGIEIDRCFTCNGVWLDDGELEKLTGEEGSSIVKSITSIFRRKS